MKTRAKGVTVGPATVIVAASSRLPGTGAWRHKRKEGVFSRSVTGLTRAVAVARMAGRQLERAGMMLGALAAGLELAREIRLAGSTGTPSGGHSSGRSTTRGSSESPSGRPARSRTSRTGSSSGANRSASKSPRRATNKRPGNRTTAKQTRGARTTATKRAGSRATAKKAGGGRTVAKKQARSRASGKRTRSSGRSRSSSRR